MMILCKETYKSIKTLAKLLLSAHVSRAWIRSVKEILPALPSTAVLQHATAQQHYCKQEQVYYIEISCRWVIWADYAFPVSMSGNWAECTLIERNIERSVTRRSDDGWRRVKPEHCWAAGHIFSAAENLVHP